MTVFCLLLCQTSAKQSYNIAQRQNSGKRKMSRPPRSAEEVISEVIMLADGIASGQSTFSQRCKLKTLTHTLQTQIQVSYWLKMILATNTDK